MWAGVSENACCNGMVSLRKDCFIETVAHANTDTSGSNRMPAVQPSHARHQSGFRGVT